MKRLNKAQAEPVNTAAMPLPKVFAWLNRFAPALEKRGIQFDQLRLILATKNLLAAREPSGMGSLFSQRKRGKDASLRTGFLWNLLFGVIIGLMMFLPASALTLFTIFFSVQLLTSFLNILTTYSSLILDPRDRTVFASRGVNDRTLSFARILNVCFYLGITLLAMGIAECHHRSSLWTTGSRGWAVGTDTKRYPQFSDRLICLFTGITLFRWRTVTQHAQLSPDSIDDRDLRWRTVT